MSQEIVESVCERKGCQTEAECTNLIFYTNAITLMQVEFQKNGSISYPPSTCDLFMPARLQICCQDDVSSPSAVKSKQFTYVDLFMESIDFSGAGQTNSKQSISVTFRLTPLLAWKQTSKRHIVPVRMSWPAACTSEPAKQRAACFVKQLVWRTCSASSLA